MRSLKLVVFLCVLSAPSAYAIDFTQIRSERAFRDFVVGRILLDEFGGQFQLQSNGAITGRIDNTPLQGGWAWREGHLCRRLFIGQVDQGTECQSVFIRANQLVLERPRYGQALIYTILTPIASADVSPKAHR